MKLLIFSRSIFCRNSETGFAMTPFENYTAVSKVLFLFMGCFFNQMLACLSARVADLVELECDVNNIANLFDETCDEVYVPACDPNYYRVYK